MTVVFGPLVARTAASVPTATMRPSRTATAWAIDDFLSSVTTFPPWRIRSAGCAGGAATGQRLRSNTVSMAAILAIRGPINSICRRRPMATAKDDDDPNEQQQERPRVRAVDLRHLGEPRRVGNRVAIVPRVE